MKHVCHDVAALAEAFVERKFDAGLSPNECFRRVQPVLAPDFTNVAQVNRIKLLIARIYSMKR